MFVLFRVQNLILATLFSIVFHTPLLASVMNQQGWEAWYQNEVVQKIPEPYQGIMNPAGARFISDEVRTACFSGPTVLSPFDDHSPTYLTNIFNPGLSTFPADPVMAMIRAFFPCPEGVLFVPAQATSNPLSTLSSRSVGELLHFIYSSKDLTPQAIYTYLHGEIKSKNPVHILDKKRVLQGGRALFGNKGLLCIREMIDEETYNAMDINARDNDEETQAFLALDELGKLKFFEQESHQMRVFFAGRLEESYRQMKAHQEYKSLAQELNNKRVPVNRLKEKLKKSKTQSLNPKDQEMLKKFEQELAEVENRRQTLLQEVPDIHAFDNEGHYSLSQVAYLVYDAWTTKNENIFGPNLVLKTLLAFAYHKAQENDDVLDFYQAFLNTHLSKDSDHFKAIQPFSKERYEWLKTASRDEIEATKTNTLENTCLFLYGLKAFEADARDLQLYSTARFEKKTFANCVETTVLNFLILLGQREMNVEIDALPGDPIPQLRVFIDEYKTPELMNGQNAKDAFANIVSNLPGIFYEKPASSARAKRSYELFSGIKNTYAVLCYLLGIKNESFQDPEEENVLSASTSDDSESLESDSEDENSDNDDEAFAFIETTLKNLFGDALESVEGFVDPIAKTDDFQGELMLNMANGRKYLWSSSATHAFIEENFGAGSASLLHPLLEKSVMAAYPEFSDQISMQGLSAPAHPTEMFPIALTKDNAWAIATGLKKSKELQMWYAHALLTQGPRQLSPLGIEILANLFEDDEWHLKQYFGQLHGVKPLSKEDFRTLILHEPETINLPIGPFKKRDDGDPYEVVADTPTLHFLDDPEIMDIARLTVETINTYKNTNPSLDQEYLLWIHTQTQMLIDMICSDNKSWTLSFVGVIPLGEVNAYTYKISDPEKFLDNLPKLENVTLIYGLDLSGDKPFPRGIVQKIKCSRTIFQCNDNISLDQLTLLISWVETNPHFLEPGKRKFIIDFSRYPSTYSYSKGEKMLSLVVPEAQTFYQGLDKPIHQNLYIQYHVETSPTSSISKNMQLRKFFTKEEGSFAKQMLYLNPPESTTKQ